MKIRNGHPFFERSQVCIYLCAALGGEGQGNRRSGEVKLIFFIGIGIVVFSHHNDICDRRVADLGPVCTINIAPLSGGVYLEPCCQCAAFMRIGVILQIIICGSCIQHRFQRGVIQALLVLAPAQHIICVCLRLICDSGHNNFGEVAGLIFVITTYTVIARGGKGEHIAAGSGKGVNPVASHRCGLFLAVSDGDLGLSGGPDAASLSLALSPRKRGHKRQHDAQGQQC